LVPGRSRTVDPEVDDYARSNEAYFEAAIEVGKQLEGAEIEWLVDASKDPYRLYWLAQSGRFDIKVVHIAKDPRAFVYSAVRSSGEATVRKVGRQAVRWTADAIIGSRVGHVSVGEDRYLPLRYEDLVGDPDRSVARIHSWMGLDPITNVEDAFLNGHNHGVAGNKLRWTAAPIRADAAWREGLPKRLQRLAWGMGRPMTKRWGYARD
jgi:hypothetical protein